MKRKMGLARLAALRSQFTIVNPALESDGSPPKILTINKCSKLVIAIAVFCSALLWAAPSARAIVIQYQFVPTSGDLAATGVLYLPSPGLSQAGVTPLTGSFFDPHYLNSQGQPIGQFLLDTLFTTGIGGVDGFELSGGGFRLRMNSGGNQGWALQVQQGPFFLDLPGESGAGNWVVASSVPDGGATATMLAFSLVAVAAVARQKLQSKTQLNRNDETLAKFWLASGILALTLFFSPFAARAVVLGTNGLPMQIVTCRDDVDVDALLKEHGLTPKHRYRHALNGFAAPMPPALIERLRRDSRVLYVEADGIVTLESQTVPAGVSRIGADMFSVGHSNALLNVDVAVLDSGIDPHEDLTRADGSSVVYSNYWAFGTDGSDSTGHGTEVVGVIAAQDNGVGVVGVAPGVRIWNVKCIGPAPYNTWSLVFHGMDYGHLRKLEIKSAL